MVDYAWYPHPGPQQDFCSRPEFEVLFGGAAGPGKTDCLIMEAARQVNHPQYKAVIFRRTFPQLQEIIDRCHHWYPQIDNEAYAGGRLYYRATEHRWHFPGGATVALSHMQNEGDKYNHQGKEYHFIGFDEVTQFSKTQYLYLFSRARSTVLEIRPRIRCTSNPGGIGHVWCKERFVDPVEAGHTYIDPVTGLSRAFVPATIYDNPSLMEADPEYLARLEALPEIERKRLLEGVWDIFEGQSFPELSQRVHSCDPFEPPPEWEKFMVFDWGYAKPFAVGWFAVDFDGVLYMYREWYGCKDGEADEGLRMTASAIATGIIEHELRDNVRFRLADPACWSKPPQKNGMQGPSVIEEMNRQGLVFMKADNNRVLGKQQVHERLKMEQVTDSDGVVVKEYPRMVVARDCEHFWRTMPLIYGDSRNVEDVDTDQEDHVYDIVRYACMARPVIPKRTVTIPPGSFMAERNRLIRARKYSQRHGVSLAVAYTRVR